LVPGESHHEDLDRSDVQRLAPVDDVREEQLTTRLEMTLPPLGGLRHGREHDSHIES
jgi:hypothetical protein